MKTSKCNECGYEISIKTDTCPNCGEPMGIKLGGFSGLLSRIILVLMAAYILYSAFELFTESPF